MDCVVGMTRTPSQVPDVWFATLREHLDEGQLVELTHHIALENQRSRFNVAFDVKAARFQRGHGVHGARFGPAARGPKASLPVPPGSGHHNTRGDRSRKS